MFFISIFPFIISSLPLQKSLIAKLTINSKCSRRRKALDRQTSKISFSNDRNKWKKEAAQLNTMMDIYKEIFLAGIICPVSKFFVSRRTSDINDWMQSVKELQLNRLLDLLATKQPNELLKLVMDGKQFRLLKISRFF